MRRPLKRICAHPGCGQAFELPTRANRATAAFHSSHRYCHAHAPLHTHSHRKTVNPQAEARRQKVYRDKRWKVCKRIVKERDGYQCVLCEATELESPLVVDHIGGIDFTDPFNPDKCRTLCLVCSGREDGKRGTKQ